MNGVVKSTEVSDLDDKKIKSIGVNCFYVHIETRVLC